MPNRRVRILHTKTIFKGNVFSVRQDRIAEPGGIRVTRDIVVHRGSVVVLPVFPDGSILLVRQYRHAIGASLWELVAGRLEAGESRPAAARRELIEETGCTALRVKANSGDLPFPGICHRTHVDLRSHGFAARRGAAGRRRAHHRQNIFASRAGKNDSRRISARRKIRRRDSFLFALPEIKIREILRMRGVNALTMTARCDSESARRGGIISTVLQFMAMPRKTPATRDSCLQRAHG